MAGEVQKANVGNVSNYLQTLTPDEVKQKKENEKFFNNLSDKMKDAGLTLEHAENKGLNKESQKLLTTYGLEKETVEWVGIDNVQLEEKNGVKKLVLTSSTDNYKLSIDIDATYEPENISMFRAEDDANIHFKGIKGEMEILGSYNQGGFDDQSVGFAFEDCSITVKGADGVKDFIAIEGETKATIITNDYADSVDVRGPQSGFWRLKPGETNIDTHDELKFEHKAK